MYFMFRLFIFLFSSKNIYIYNKLTIKLNNKLTIKLRINKITISSTIIST